VHFNALAVPNEREVTVNLVEDRACAVGNKIVVTGVLDRVRGHDDGRVTPYLRHRPHAAQKVDKLGVVIGAFACVSACKIDPPISGLVGCLLWREAGGGGC